MLPCRVIAIQYLDIVMLFITSIRALKLHVKRSSAPASVECLNSLTGCINCLLAGTLDSCLVPWFCGALLTALDKKGGGFRPISVGETLCCLVSKVCCFSVCSSLPNCSCLLGRLVLVFRVDWKLLYTLYALFSPHTALILPYAV